MNYMKISLFYTNTPFTIYNFFSSSIYLLFYLLLYFSQYHLYVVATTRRNGTCSLLTSAKLSVGYLVVGITRELDKEPSLH